MACNTVQFADLLKKKYPIRQWSRADKHSFLARRPAPLFTFHGTYRRQQIPQVHKDQAEKNHHCNYGNYCSAPWGPLTVPKEFNWRWTRPQKSANFSRYLQHQSKTTLTEICTEELQREPPRNKRGPVQQISALLRRHGEQAELSSKVQFFKKPLIN